MEFESKGSLNIYRIIAINRMDNTAYAEKIGAYTLLDGRAYCRALDGSYFFTDRGRIIHNAVIIRRCAAPWLFLVKVGAEE